MKTLLTLILAAASTWALPVMLPDSQTVPANDPRIGQHVIVTPLTNWMVYANDNPPPTLGDRDYNDGWMSIVIGADGSGSATWEGSNAAWSNWFTVDGYTVSALLPSANFGPQTVGANLPVTFYAQDGGVYPTGRQNVMTENVTSVPEPGSLAIIGSGLLLISLWRRS